MTWILLLLVAAYILRKRKNSRKIAFSALVVFLIFSNPILFCEVFKGWEGRNEVKLKEHYDVVLVLGGYSGWNTRHNTLSFNDAGDRFIEALTFYKKGIADKIMLSGGSGLILKPEEKESNWSRHLLMELGVNSEDILVENESRNTHENAENSAKILKEQYGDTGKFLLITSGFHMNRAMRCFEKTELSIDYWRVDFLVDDDDYNLETFLLPSAYTLELWQLLIKEWLGYITYWLRGYF
jgi:uncharacterized SAM-binding protein YcdF (DUF218 family)